MVTIYYFYLIEKDNLKTKNKFIVIDELKRNHKMNIKLWERECYKAFDYYAEKPWIKEVMRYITFKASCFDYSSLYATLTTLNEDEIIQIMHLEENEKQEM